MKERIDAVQKAFWLLIGTSAVILLAALPLGKNGQLMEVLQELTRFKGGFDRVALEEFLLKQAGAQGQLPLGEVAKAIEDDETSKFTVSDAAPVLKPFAHIDLSTLRSANRFSRPGASVEIGAPSPQEMAAAISWRLSRSREPQAYELVEIALHPAPMGKVGEKEVALEREVVVARKAASEADTAWNQATNVHKRAEALHKARLKRKAPWKSILKAREKLKEAELDLQQKTQAKQQTASNYRTLAKKAERFRSAKDASKGKPAAGYAVAVATLKAPSDGSRFTLTFPVALNRRTVSVSSLTGCDFTATKRAGLWKAVADGAVDDAIEYVEGQFSWHYQRVQIADVDIGGMTFLRWSPLTLLAMLVLLWLRMGNVEGSYNPFGTERDLSLPAVGFHFAPVNFAAIVLLPVVACVLCVWSLKQIAEPVFVPLACAFLALGLGVMGHLRMNALKNLRDAVRRSHSSFPPPRPGA